MNEIKILVISNTKESERNNQPNTTCELPKNYFVIDRAENENVILPPPPKHFKYVEEDRKGLCFYELVEDENDPPLPASILRLHKMSFKKLKAIASRNDLGGWANLNKPNLLKFLERHRYVFTNDFYKQRSLKLQIQAWVGLFSSSNLAEHYTEVMLNVLTKSGYYKPNAEPEYCWWKGSPLSDVYERDVFLGGPNSILVFHRDMGLRFRKMIVDIETPIRERLIRGECQEMEGGNMRWKEKTHCVWENMVNLIYKKERVWDEREIEQFLSFAKKTLEKFCRLLVLGDLSMKEELEKLNTEQKRAWKN